MVPQGTQTGCIGHQLIDCDVKPEQAQGSAGDAQVVDPDQGAGRILAQGEHGSKGQQGIARYQPPTQGLIADMSAQAAAAAVDFGPAALL